MDASIIVILLIGVGVILLAWWFVLLLEVLRTPVSRWRDVDQSQMAYIVLMAIVFIIGTIAYVLVARKKIRSFDGNGRSINIH